jgi:hypothetical protein
VVRSSPGHPLDRRGLVALLLRLHLFLLAALLHLFHLVVRLDLVVRSTLALPDLLWARLNLVVPGHPEGLFLPANQRVLADRSNPALPDRLWVRLNLVVPGHPEGLFLPANQRVLVVRSNPALPDRLWVRQDLVVPLHLWHRSHLADLRGPEYFLHLPRTKYCRSKHTMNH